MFWHIGVTDVLALGNYKTENIHGLDAVTNRQHQGQWIHQREIAFMLFPLSGA